MRDCLGSGGRLQKFSQDSWPTAREHQPVGSQAAAAHGGGCACAGRALLACRAEAVPVPGGRTSAKDELEDMPKQLPPLATPCAGRAGLGRPLAKQIADNTG